MNHAQPLAGQHMPRFILCADDFAITQGVSRGILELLAARRISATGAMTNRPHWPIFASELMAFSGQADLGVHLNLTCATPLSRMPLLAPSGQLPALPALARAAISNAQARHEIGEEIRCQLDAFEQATGRTPDFIDGHQHVHALPGIRGQVIDAASQRYKRGTVYLRDPSDTASAILRRHVSVQKAMTVAAMATGLASQAKARGIPVNKGFSGFSPFDPARNFADDMARYVIKPGHSHLVMCHPGHVDDELARIDPVVATRQMEWLTLMKIDFGQVIRFGDSEHSS